MFDPDDHDDYEDKGDDWGCQWEDSHDHFEDHEEYEHYEDESGCDY